MLINATRSLDSDASTNADYKIPYPSKNIRGWTKLKGGWNDSSKEVTIFQNVNFQTWLLNLEI